MSRLVVSRNLSLFFRYDAALFLRSDAYFYKRMTDIFLLDKHSVILCSYDRSFIQQVFKIRPCKSCRRLSDLFQIHIFRQRFVFRMNFQDLLSAADIRPAYKYVSVETSWS